MDPGNDTACTLVQLTGFSALVLTEFIADEEVTVEKAPTLTQVDPGAPARVVHTVSQF